MVRGRVTTRAAAILVAAGVLAGAFGYYVASPQFASTVTITSEQARSISFTATITTTAEPVTTTITQTVTFTLSQGPIALVSTGGVSCSISSRSCTMVLQNTGNANITTSGVCSVTYSGETVSGSLGGGGTVPASGTLGGVTCALSALPGAAVGTPVTGTVGLSTGPSAPFSGTWAA
jgi:hypothetical protein